MLSGTTLSGMIVVYVVRYHTASYNGIVVIGVSYSLCEITAMHDNITKLCMVLQRVTLAVNDITEESARPHRMDIKSIRRAAEK